METHTAGSAAEARDELLRLQAAGTPCDAVIVDATLPDADGLKLALELCALAGLQPRHALLLAPMTHSIDSTSANAAGIGALLPKPVRTWRLLDSLAVALSGQRLPARRSSDDTLEPSVRELAGLRVLLVEDSAINQRIAQTFLRRLGVRCEVASNGQQALELLCEPGQRFDAVLMDCQMPLLDGYEATRELRRRESSGSRTPVIALTANTLPSDCQRCLDAGMDDYLAKPVSQRALAEKLAHWARTPES
jgi:CheY-like chemotaxis protein